MDDDDAASADDVGVFVSTELGLYRFDPSAAMANESVAWIAAASSTFRGCALGRFGNLFCSTTTAVVQVEKTTGVIGWSTADWPDIVGVPVSHPIVDVNGKVGVIFGGSAADPRRVRFLDPFTGESTYDFAFGGATTDTTLYGWAVGFDSALYVRGFNVPSGRFVM